MLELFSLYLLSLRVEEGKGGTLTYGTEQGEKRWRRKGGVNERGCSQTEKTCRVTKKAQAEKFQEFRLAFFHFILYTLRT
jgi:hypothetical protein